MSARPLPLRAVLVGFVLALAAVAVLVVVDGLPVATAAAAVVLYRAATYWLPLLVGGGVTAVLAVGDRRARLPEEG